MGDELVSGLSPQNGDGQNVPVLSYTREFEKCLPYYLSIGMSWEQFWHGDVEMARFYRQAHEMQLKQKNFELWLQGRYVYEAIGDMVPVLHAFAKEGSTPTPYPREPYPLTQKDVREQEERERREQYERMKAYVNRWANETNAKNKRKEGMNNV